MVGKVLCDSERSTVESCRFGAFPPSALRLRKTRENETPRKQGNLPAPPDLMLDSTEPNGEGGNRGYLALFEVGNKGFARRRRRRAAH